MTKRLDLSGGLSSIERMITRLQSPAKEFFPFERELTLYLLLIASIFPDAPARLLTAARIFSGALNLHARIQGQNANFRYREHKLKFHDAFTKRRLSKFNKIFFREIGDWPSLLFTPSASEFHDAVTRRLGELQMLHDTINYILKASTLSRQLSSSNLAYNAISKNFFNRKNGYGVKIGEKKRRRTTILATTPSYVREKWKRAPNTLFLSFVMTEMFSIHRHPPTDVRFFAYLHFKVDERPGDLIAHILSLMQGYMKNGTPEQNASIEKWSRFSQHKTGHGFLGHQFRFSKKQLLRAMDLSDEIFKRRLSPDERDRILKTNKRRDMLDFADIATRG